jgi:hypothetical protein
VGGQVVSDVPDQLPRSRAYAAGPRRRTRPRVGGLLARSVLRYVTECKELIARIVGCSCGPGGRCCGGDLVDAVAGIANDRREPAVAREISRRNLVFGWTRRVRTMKQSFASAARLRSGGPARCEIGRGGRAGDRRPITFGNRFHVVTEPPPCRCRPTELAPCLLWCLVHWPVGS